MTDSVSGCRKTLDLSAKIAYENFCNSADLPVNPPSQSEFSRAATESIILFQRGQMRESGQRLSLFNQSGSRKYLNAAERWRFIEAAQCAPLSARHFCLTLGFSGARISEVLA